MTFQFWLKKYRAKDTAIGDLARDAERDSEFQHIEIATREHLVRYLKSKSACAEVIQTARQAWARWEKRDQPARRGIGKRLRFAILERDEFRCRYCGRSAPDVALHVDHAIAYIDGGGDEEENLVTSCADCNLGKGSISIEERHGKATVLDLAPLVVSVGNRSFALHLCDARGRSA